MGRANKSPGCGGRACGRRMMDLSAKVYNGGTGEQRGEGQHSALSALIRCRSSSKAAEQQIPPPAASRPPFFFFTSFLPSFGPSSLHPLFFCLPTPPSFLIVLATEIRGLSGGRRWTLGGLLPQRSYRISAKARRGLLI